MLYKENRKLKKFIQPIPNLKSCENLLLKNKQIFVQVIPARNYRILDENLIYKKISAREAGEN